MLRSSAEHSRENGTSPIVAPLHLSDFSSVWSKLMASRSLIWHHALPTQKAQFQNTIHSLRSIIRHARLDFCAVAEVLAIEDIVFDNPDSWVVMDRAHFDLNTCLRESFILLKCFLRVLPDNELRGFQENVSKGTSALLAPPRPKPQAVGKVSGVR